MTPATTLPRHLILAGAALSGMLLALAIHILGQRLGLDLGGLWQSGDPPAGVPANAALAWWLMAMAGFASGHVAATLMDRAASGRISRRMRHVLIGLGVVVLAAAGQAAAAPSAAPSLAGVLGGLTALCLGALMAFCGAYFALGKA